jgi:general secretion pathway protein D
LHSLVSFNFRHAPVDAVLDYLSQAFGFIVLKSDHVDARVTITSMRPVSAGAAVNALDGVLKPLHYTIIRTGRDLRIVALDQAEKANVPVHYGADPARIADTDQIITQVIPIESVDASRLCTNLTPLLSSSAIVTANKGSNTIIITDTSANIRRIVKIIADVDRHRAAATHMRIYHLKYADAASTATLINAVFNPTTSTNQPSGPPLPLFRRVVRFLKQNQRNNTGGNQIGGKVNASADERTNSIVVTGPTGALALVDQIVKQIDHPAAMLDIRMYHLKYADAASTATLINTVFNPSTSTNQPSGLPQPLFRRVVSFIKRTQQNNAAGNGTGGMVNATADEQTNTIIVTGSAGAQALVDQVVKRIDHPAAMLDMRIYHLKNADATDTATLINAVFNPSTSANQPSGLPQPLFRRVVSFIKQTQQNNAAGNGTGGVVNATADERTNTIIVTGPAEALVLVGYIVKEIDSNPAAKQVFFIYRLKNAEAATVQYVLNSLFGNPTYPPQATPGMSNVFGASSFTSSFGAFGNSRGATTFAGGPFGSFANGNNTNLAAGVNGVPTTATNALTGQAYIVADTSTNSLLVSTSQKYAAAVKGMIRQLDRPVPQVLIKVLVAEVTLDNSTAIGTEFSILDQRTRLVPTGQVTGSIAPNGSVTGATGTANVTNYGTSGGSAFGIANAVTSAAANGTPSGLVVGLVENNLTATLQALAQKNKLDVLSRPYILTSDNQEATMMVGQEVPIITNSTITTQGTVVNTPSYQQVGIILDVTPQINPDGVVTLNVAPQVSQLESGAGVTVSPGVTAPIFDIRQAQSRVAVKNGQTIVIGGLMQDEKTQTISKIPLLGDIPYIGPLLFSRAQNEKTKTELLIFLTPHVIPQPAGLKVMSHEEERGMQLVPKAVGPGVFQTQMKDMRRGALPEPAATQATENPVHDIKLSR